MMLVVPVPRASSSRAVRASRLDVTHMCPVGTRNHLRPERLGGAVPVSPKRAGKAVVGAAGGLGVVAAVARAAVSRGLPGGTWVAVVVLAAGITIVAGLALVLDYHRDRLEIAARAAESKARAELQLCRMEMYRDLVGKASGEPASSAGYRALILADALHMAVEEEKVSPADRTHGSLYGAGSDSRANSGPT